MNKRETARHYCDVYDSLQQAKHMASGNQQLSRYCQYYVARLRLDTILARKTIIKDAELLNGLFFLSVTESNLFKELPFDRIEIRAREKNLEHALLRLFVPPKARTVRGIFFHALSKENAKLVRAQLDRYPASKVKDRRSLCEALRRCGMNQDLVEKLNHNWSQWIDMSKSRGVERLAVIPWNKFDFDEILQEKLSETKASTKAKLTRDGQELLNEVWECRSDRGAVVAKLRSTHAEANNSDVATIKSWHGAAYNRTVAQHHGCQMVEITDEPESRPIGVSREIFDWALENPSEIPSELTVEISGPFLEAFSRYPKVDLELFLKRHKENLELWYNDRTNLPALRRVVHELVEEVDRVVSFDSDSVVPSWLASELKLIALAGAAGAGSKVAAALAGADPKKSTRRRFLKGIGFVVGASVAGHLKDPADRMFEKKDPVERRIIERATKIRSA